MILLHQASVLHLLHGLEISTMVQQQKMENMLPKWSSPPIISCDFFTCMIIKAMSWILYLQHMIKTFYSVGQILQVPCFGRSWIHRAAKMPGGQRHSHQYSSLLSSSPDSSEDGEWWRLLWAYLGEKLGMCAEWPLATSPSIDILLVTGRRRLTCD